MVAESLDATTIEYKMPQDLEHAVWFSEHGLNVLLSFVLMLYDAVNDRPEVNASSQRPPSERCRLKCTYLFCMSSEAIHIAVTLPNTPATSMRDETMTATRIVTKAVEANMPVPTVKTPMLKNLLKTRSAA